MRTITLALLTYFSLIYILWYFYSFVSLSHHIVEFFIFKSYGLLKTADLAVENLHLESIFARVTRELTRPPIEYNPDLNKNQKVCHKGKDL